MNLPIPKRHRRMAPESSSLASGSGSFIPDDIFFFHILVLLPVGCLVRFQTVCKSWRTTITCSVFVRRHLELSIRTRSSMVLVPRKYQMGSGFLSIYSYQPGQSKVAKLKFPIPMFSIPLHCDGLILIPCIAGKIFICNPATREFLELPNRTVELPPGTPNALFEHRVAFGFDPWSGTYKVARHFIRSYTDTLQIDGGGTIREYKCGHEILTLGDSMEAWSWKATVDPPYRIKPRTPICLPGFFFWSALKSKAHDDNGMAISEVNVILRFSLLDETFTVHPNPPCRDYLSDNDALSALGGKLCYIHSATPKEIAIWLAGDGPNLTWSLCHRVNLPIARSLRVFACETADLNKTFLSIDANNLFKCNLHDGSLEEIICLPQDLQYDLRNRTQFNTGILPYAHYMVPFVESLLRIRPK